jgi:AcrR family transcriptional regulator
MKRSDAADDLLQDEAPRSKKSRRRAPYHHGNLPAALVAAARQVIEEEGSDALTLRTVARRVGVTHAAPYRHFKDKKALLCAVAADGAERLAESLRDAMQQATPAVATEALGRAYLNFSREHAALYSLIFDVDSVGKAHDAVFNCFVKLITRVRGDTAVDVDAAAGAMWALWHGVATLALSGRLDRVCAVTDAAVDASLALTQSDMDRMPRSTQHPTRAATAEPSDVGDP